MTCNDLQWLAMTCNDSWWLMMTHDDSWWLMMTLWGVCVFEWLWITLDDSRWLLMTLDNSWWLMMTLDDSWWLLMTLWQFSDILYGWWKFWWQKDIHTSYRWTMLVVKLPLQLIMLFGILTIQLYIGVYIINIIDF